MEQLVYKINEIDYLLFTIMCRKKQDAENIQNEIKKYKGILQSCTFEDSFLNGITVKIVFLIPVKNAVIFSNN